MTGGNSTLETIIQILWIHVKKQCMSGGEDHI